MKLKKIITKCLILCTALNNLHIYSLPNSLSRYEILEDLVITIENAKTEDIVELEIFGNTVQNSNNLEDIQSVGDLHVDDEGNPILDSQGREQYKIEIISTDYNRLYSNEELAELYNKMGYSNVRATTTPDGLFKCVNNGAWLSPVKVFKGKPNTEYTFSFMARSGCIYTNGLTLVRSHSEFVKTYRTDSTGNFGFLVSPNVGDTFDFKIYEGNIPDINSMNEQKTKITVLLPCQLMKIGKVKDRLYWNDEKNKYIIEKNVYTNILESMTNKYGDFFQLPTYKYPFDATILDGATTYGGNYLVQGFEHSGYAQYAKTEGNLNASYYSSLNLRLYPYKNKTTGEATNLSIDEVNNIIGEGKTVYLPYKTSQLIETSITKKIKLTTYSEKTYISTVSENNIKPTLKITVDRIEEVSQEAVNNVISNPTSNNIALARMFVNMLPDSLYKDQLQAQLNEIFSEDMVLEKQSATANLDVYIKSENILMMSLDTNTITFEDYSGVEDLEILDAINISINSSLPYSLNAYITGDIVNKDKNKTLDLDIFNIRDSIHSEYKKFASLNSKLILSDNVSAGNNIKHNIDLKLTGDNAPDVDIYKTTIKFEAEQK